MPRRRKQKLELWIGALVLVSAVVLLWGYFWLTGQPLGERGYTVHVVLPHAGGIERGDRVEIAGVEVGVVRSVKLVDPKRVVVSLWLKRDLRIPRDSRAMLESVGVFGDKVVVLEPGRAPTPAADGDTLALGVTSGLMDLAGTIGEQASDLLTQLERLLADSTIDQVHGSVAALPATIRDVDKLIRENGEQFAAMSESLRRTADALAETLDGADIDQAVADLGATAASLAETAEQLQQTAEAIASVAAKIDDGEGTLGLLVNDPGLYRDLRSATQSLRSLTDDIRENPGRYIKLAIF